ncbi:hypothetical protein [Candidatus Viadribacter manganicus]|uniref:Peptidase C-terminal archaeal/bacterial domain-containing protein n=1 Tax=Candidatus Viadribacter manganicus TaxID=1759059 RepID=A0A1B1AH87_9PROT|nr:hypothetical protein [Candidatus Viadribacter manganicus]ANP45929.1 hypothetical protein ATE48_08340 [Candidatus Viadribacter manganicus]
MRQFLIAAAAACMLAACGAGADGPPLPRVQAGATPPSTQSPGSPTQQAQVTDEVRQQLIAQIGTQLGQLQGANAGNYTQVGSDTIVPMQPGHDHRFIVDLTAGTEYGFIGSCDGDCSNVDLELISMETGGVVANDMLPDDYPIFPYTPTANGQYMVRLLMQACTTSPCYAGVRIVSNGANAAPPQVPQQQTGGATTGGATPGKP